MNYKRSDYAGGIAKMYLVPAAAAASIRRELVSGSYLMPGLSNFLIPVQFAIDSGRFTVTNKLGAWQIRIEAFIPSSLAVDSLAFFSQWVGKPFNILVQDYNGNYIYFGNRDNFFIYRPQFSSAQDFSEASGFSFNLQRDMLVPPIHIVSPFLRQAPEALVVRIPVYPSENKEVTGSYEYRSFDDRPESGSVYAWHLADTSTGPKTAITGETAITFTPLAEHVGKFLFFSVIPSDGSLQGRQVFSNPAYILAAADAPSDYQGPEALNVRIIGTPIVGNSLSVAYNYLDSMDYEEYGTTFQWRQMSHPQSSASYPIGSTKDIILTPEMKGRYIFAIVTPASANGIGDSVRTPATGGLKVLPKTGTVRINPADILVQFAHNLTASIEPFNSDTVLRLTKTLASGGAAATLVNANPLNIPPSSRVVATIRYGVNQPSFPSTTVVVKDGPLASDQHISEQRRQLSPAVQGLSASIEYLNTTIVGTHVQARLLHNSEIFLAGDHINVYYIDVTWEEA